MLKTPRFLSLSLLVLAVACRAPTGQFPPVPAQDKEVTNANVTRIYVLREDSVGLHSAHIRVFDGDTEIGTFDSGSYVCWERSPGRTVGRAYYDATDPGKGQVEGIADFDCGAGKAYYFNVTVEKDEGKPTVTPLSPEEGRRLVAERKPVEHAKK